MITSAMPTFEPTRAKGRIFHSVLGIVHPMALPDDVEDPNLAAGWTRPDGGEVDSTLGPGLAQLLPPLDMEHSEPGSISAGSAARVSEAQITHSSQGRIDGRPNGVTCGCLVP